MEPLKEMFNAAYYTRLASAVQQVHPTFARAAFLRDVQKGNAERELNARMRHTSNSLRKHLPDDVRKATALLTEVAPLMPRGYTALLYPDFVGRYGLDDPARGLEALRYFTSFGSSEFAVREFFRRDPAGTLKVMRKWAEDDNEHVRRLASEGSRPRLPWSFRLDAVMKDPSLTTPILERLREDPALYVRKSVANHLNDFSKDHPEHMLDLLRTWGMAHPHTAWIAKHASRTLIKAGRPEALALFAFDTKARLRVEDFTLEPARAKLGDTLEFAFTLISEDKRLQRVVVDYAIHYCKSAGNTSRKVFKLKEVELAPKASISISKRQPLVDLSTRKHHPGIHRVEVLANGRKVAEGLFDLRT